MADDHVERNISTEVTAFQHSYFHFRTLLLLVVLITFLTCYATANMMDSAENEYRMCSRWPVREDIAARLLHGVWAVPQRLKS